MPYINRGGQRIYYETHGASEGIVMLHGLLTSPEWWQPVAGHFTDRYTVIAPEAPGHGATNPLRRPVRVKEMAAQTVALAESLDLKRFCLMGHSLGGIVAQQIALDYPDKVTSLVLISAIPRVRWKYALPLTLFALACLFGLAKWDERIRGAVRAALSPRLPGEVIEWAADDMARVPLRQAALVGLGLVGWNVERRLHEIKVPTLVIVGERDGWRADSELLAQEIPDALYVEVPECSHAVTIEDPDTIARECGVFLKASEAGRPRPAQVRADAELDPAPVLRRPGRGAERG